MIYSSVTSTAETEAGFEYTPVLVATKLSQPLYCCGVFEGRKISLGIE